MSTRQTLKKTHHSRKCIQNYFKQFRARGLNGTCECGLPQGHQAWCWSRLQRSPARMELLARWNRFGEREKIIRTMKKESVTELWNHMPQDARDKIWRVFGDRIFSFSLSDEMKSRMLGYYEVWPWVQETLGSWEKLKSEKEIRKCLREPKEKLKAVRKYLRERRKLAVSPSPREESPLGQTSQPL